MKLSLNKFSLIVTMSVLIKFYFPLNLRLNKSEDFKIDDKEIESMLNDPKFSNIAADLNKLKSSRVEMERAGAELKAMGIDPSKPKKDSGTESSLKELSDFSGGLDSFFKTGLDKPKKSSSILGSASSTDDILAKFGDFKDLGLDFGTEKIDLGLGASPPAREAEKGKKEPEKPKNPVDEQFKNLYFLTKQQARLLLEILKQPVFFGMLPQEAQQIVKAVTDGAAFKELETANIDKFIEDSLENTPNSNSFIDPDGTVGRKGMLTIISPENGDFKFVWTISNSKVLCFYQSQSFLSIVKLFRNSDLGIKNINTTPCFLIFSKANMQNGSLLVCSSSTQEKEVWVQTITNNLK